MPNQAQLREDLMAWLKRAQDDGLTRDDIRAFVETTMRAGFKQD